MTKLGSPQECKVDVKFKSVTLQGWCKIHPRVTKLKKKNHTTISIDTEEAFNKIQHPVLIKILNEPGIERKSLNLIKRDLYKKTKKPRANITLSG